MVNQPNNVLELSTKGLPIKYVALYEEVRGSVTVCECDMDKGSKDHA